MKMLATGAVSATSLFGTYRDHRQAPKREHHRRQSHNAPRRSFWARDLRAHARHGPTIRRAALRRERRRCWSATSRFRGTRVFLQNNGRLVAPHYIETPPCLQNTVQLRFCQDRPDARGLASACASETASTSAGGAETLGRLAALRGDRRRPGNGQIEAWENWPEVFATPNRAWSMPRSTGARSITARSSNAAYACQAPPVQMPASIDLSPPRAQDRFERWWAPDHAGCRALQAYELVWD